MVRSTPVKDERGEAHLTIHFFRDVTEERRAHMRERLLADATAELGRSLDYQRTLASLARMVIETLASWCVVYLRDGDEAIEALEVAHADPAKAEWARRVSARYPPRPGAPRGVAEVMRTGTPELMREVDDSVLALGAQDEEHLELLRRVGFESYMCVPLVVRDRVVGALSLISADRGRRYGPEDLALASELGRRAAIAIDNAKLFEETRAATREAQEAVRRRDEFLSIASHELKTPLTSLELTLSALVRGAETGKLVSSPEILPNRLAAARRQLHRLTKLIEELLDVSRLASGRLGFEPAPMDLAQLARDVVARFEDDTARTTCPLAVDASVPVVGVWDRDRLDQVVTNLVANAVKYGAGTPVTVRVKAANDEAVLEVIDGGPGIAVEDRARIFERFERAATRNEGGFGLGLWIVKEIVEGHGGKVRVDCGSGVGSRFIVTLPLRAGERERSGT